MVTGYIALSVALELIMYHHKLWKFRLLFVIFLTLLIPALTSLYLIENVTIVGFAVALLSIHRLYNLFRIAKARMHVEYLRQATARSGKLTAALQLLMILLGSWATVDFPNLPAMLTVIAWAQVVVAVVLLAVTISNVYRTRYRQGTTFYSDKELPTVSVLIPARNETTDLEECLRSAIASDYPKLEIIVLDDCSQSKTSDIIKSFAQDGVRFVPGMPPNDNWLAKNQAYDKLAEEASGDLLLFCGVDVRFGSHAIRALVTELKVRDKHMISILPHRLSASIAGAFIQPMRYWWELALPRKLFNRPAVLSTCWLIDAKVLREFGGFRAVSHSILPEGYFARKLIGSNKYSFIRADDTLDIQTRKSLSEQRATAIRTRYPQLRRRPENVLLLTYAELVFLLGPFLLAVYALFAPAGVFLGPALVACLLLVANHVFILQLTSPANVAIALFNLPIEIITDIAVTCISMTRYEFGAVEWKDRNVCIPVMHVVPRLPAS